MRGKKRKVLVIFRQLFLAALASLCFLNLVENPTYSKVQRTQQRSKFIQQVQTIHQPYKPVATPISPVTRIRGHRNGTLGAIAILPVRSFNLFRKKSIGDGGVYYARHGNLHLMRSCKQCGDVVDLCSAFPIVDLAEVASMKIAQEFICTEDVLNVLASNFSFPRPGLVATEDGKYFFVHGNTCAHVTSFLECGPLYGDLRKSFPFFGRSSLFFLSRVGRWSNGLTDSEIPTAPVFRCSRHTNIISGFDSERSNWRRWMIIAPPRFEFLADIFTSILESNGYYVSSAIKYLPEEHEYDVYVVIFAEDHQTENTPLARKRIAVQGIPSLRRASVEYIDTLSASMSVIAMSIDHLQVLHEKGVDSHRLWYLPIGTKRHSPLPVGLPKQWDLLYINNVLGTSRRVLKLLQHITAVYNLKVVNENDKALGEHLDNSRFVLCFCSDSSASLDVSIIARSLAHGVPVIAERTVDAWSYAHFLRSSIFFFEYSSLASISETVMRAMGGSPNAQMRETAAAADLALSRVSFGINRILLGLGVIPISRAASIFIQQPDVRHPGTVTNPIILSTPEATTRFILHASRKDDMLNVIFFGVRLITKPSWISVGLSYKSAAMMILKKGEHLVAIAEDDVVFPRRRDVFEIVHRYLQHKTNEWDIFSGLIADLHADTKILSAACHEGIQFVTINRMTSMVYNIYNVRALEALSTWDPIHDDSRTNTIDRYLENLPNLRVVTTVPFFVGHDVSSYSTIWQDLKNDAYAKMIADSERKLRILLQNYLEVLEYDVAAEMACPDTLRARTWRRHAVS